MRKWMGLIIAVLVAVFAAFIVLQFSNSGRSAPPPTTGNAPLVAQPNQRAVESVNVYVAAGYIPVGTRIQESMLDTQPWPKHLVLKGFVTGAEEGRELVNQVTRSEFQKGEPIIGTKLVNPSDPNFIAGALPKGMRLVTMPTDVVTGLAGFVFPGDQVDVILTHEVLPEGAAPRDRRFRTEEEPVSEVLISNVKVMAVDQHAAVSTEGELKVPATVSIAVTPEDAQKLALGIKEGIVSLALRSINDEQTWENIAVTRKSDLTQGGSSPQKETASSGYQPVIVVRGIEVEGDKEANAAGMPPSIQ